MTVDELKELGLPIAATDTACLYVGSAIDWLIENTTLDIDKDNLQDSIKALPDGAKLFICRYMDVMETGGNGVASESIGGMSQSFTTESKTTLLWQLARGLIGAYLKSQIHSVPNVSKWV